MAVTTSETCAAPEPPNSRELRRDESRERLLVTALVVPALVLISTVVLIPVGMLVFLSFTDNSGSFTLANYLRFIDGSAYVRVFITTFKISFLTTAICGALARSDEHTSELQSLMRISYAV